MIFTRKDTVHSPRGTRTSTSRASKPKEQSIVPDPWALSRLPRLSWLSATTNPDLKAHLEFLQGTWRGSKTSSGVRPFLGWAGPPRLPLSEAQGLLPGAGQCPQGEGADEGGVEPGESGGTIRRRWEVAQAPPSGARARARPPPPPASPATPLPLSRLAHPAAAMRPRAWAPATARWLLGLVALLGPSARAWELTILHTNDVHSRLEQTSVDSSKCVNASLCVGGVARLYTKVVQIRNSDPHVLLLDAGDQYQGTIWFTVYKGAEVAHFMNALNYNAMVRGLSAGVRRSLDHAGREASSSKALLPNGELEGLRGA